MKKSIALIALTFFISAIPHVLFAKTVQPTYRYNRISEYLTVKPGGDVDVLEPVTMLYNGNFRSMWQFIPAATNTSVSNVEVMDGGTGQPFSFSPTTLDANDPASWGKFTTYVKNGTTQVEWYYNTSDRVHTWVLHYTLRGAISFASDHDEFFWTLFSGYNAPVDTVEVEVNLPRAITMPRADLFTTGAHDFYIDRPDERTFRFRVSDIAAGEKVVIKTGWQKGIVHPALALPAVLWLSAHAPLLVGVLQFVFGLAIIGFLLWRNKRAMYTARTHLNAKAHSLIARVQAFLKA